MTIKGICGKKDIIEIYMNLIRIIDLDFLIGFYWKKKFIFNYLRNVSDFYNYLLEKERFFRNRFKVH